MTDHSGHAKSGHPKGSGRPDQRQALGHPQPGATTDPPRQPTTPASTGPLPDIAARYATYLRTRTGLRPHIDMRGNAAGVWVSNGTACLVLTFTSRRGTWWPSGTELRHGSQSTTFRRGELAKAVKVFLTHQPPSG